MNPRDRSKSLHRTAGCALAAAALLAGGLPTAAQAPDDDEPIVEREVHRVVVATPPGEAGPGHKKVKVVIDKGDGEPQVREFVVPSGARWEGLRERFGEGFEGPLAAPMTWVAAGPRGYLGIEMTMLTPELRRHFGAVEDAGVMVARVEPDSPADRAGLRVGDVLTHVDGQALRSSFEVAKAIRDRKEGEIVAIELVRDGRVETVSAAIERREVPSFDVGPLVRGFAIEGGELEVDVEALSENMERIGDYFAGPEWQAQVERLEGFGTELEKRLEGLEVELERLEDELGEIDVRVEVLDGEDEGEDEDYAP